MAPPPSKKRRMGAGSTRPERSEEITFNPEARHEYLTGFHKRKVQRAKHAQEVAEKRAKEERREQRKKVLTFFRYFPFLVLNFLSMGYWVLGARC